MLFKSSLAARALKLYQGLAFLLDVYTGIFEHSQFRIAYTTRSRYLNVAGRRSSQ